MPQVAKAGWSIFSIIRWLFTLKGAISVTFVLLVLTSISAIGASFDAGTPMPLFKAIGSKILNHDQELYQAASQIEADGGVKYEAKQGTVWDDISNFFSKLGKIWTIIRNMWFMYFVYMVFFLVTLAFGMSHSDKYQRGVVALIMLLFFEILAHFIVIDPAMKVETMTTGEKFVPLRGLIKTFQVFPKILHGVPMFAPDNMTASPGAGTVTPNASIDVDFGVA